MQLANRLNDIAESITLAVTAKANALKKAGVGWCCLLSVPASPDFDTPQFIKDAAIKALLAGKTKYEATPGTIEARKAIADKLKRENGLDYTPEQIIVSVGGKHALYVAFMATLNPGDEVIIPAPYWVSYPEMVKLAGGVPVIIKGRPCPIIFASPRHQIEHVISDKTRMFIMNSPSNPGGHTYSPKRGANDLPAVHSCGIRTSGSAPTKSARKSFCTTGRRRSPGRPWSRTFGWTAPLPATASPKPSP